MDYGSPVSLVDVAKSDSTVASEGEQAGVKEDIPVSAEVLRRDLGGECFSTETDLSLSLSLCVCVCAEGGDAYLAGWEREHAYFIGDQRAL